MRPISIGALSNLTGVKVPTIRYYESIGLLAHAARTESNRRTYIQDDINRLQFVRHARELGFEIEAIRQLIDIASDPTRHCAEVDEIARRHLADIDYRIARLSALRIEVQRMVENCSRGLVSECRVIEVLADHSKCATDHGHRSVPG
jgi:DNA-binding transcriptional MerR regulator